MPNKDFTEDDINEIMYTGRVTTPCCNLQLVNKGDLILLEEIVKAIRGEFVFVYVVHGSYFHNSFVAPTGYMDGELIIKPYENNEKSNAAFDLATILCKSNVQSVFLNCCQGIRNVEIKNEPGVEDIYFSNKNLNLLMGFRSNILDNEVRFLSSDLISAILSGKTMLEYLSIINKKFLENSKTVREQIARVNTCS